MQRLDPTANSVTGPNDVTLALRQRPLLYLRTSFEGQCHPARHSCSSLKMSTQSHSRVRTAMKRLRASLTRIRRCGGINKGQKQIVQDACSLLGLSSRVVSHGDDAYKELLKKVQDVAGLEMVVLCAVGLGKSPMTKSPTTMRILVQDLPLELGHKRNAWNCFELQRLVREHLAGSFWVLFPSIRLLTFKRSLGTSQTGNGLMDISTSIGQRAGSVRNLRRLRPTKIRSALSFSPTPTGSS